MADADPVAYAIRPAPPAGIDQPAVDLWLDYLPLEKIGVESRVVHHERRAEACAEGDLRLDSQPHLGAADFSRVAGDEVIQHLVRRQACQRRRPPPGLAGGR